MRCEKLFFEIYSLYGKYIDVLEEVCDIESPTDCKEGLDKVGTQGGGMHTADEFAFKKSLAESAKRVASVIYCI